MPNGDKVKAATKHGPSDGEKRRAVANAHKKAYNTKSRLDAAHHNAANYEDSLCAPLDLTPTQHVRLPPAHLCVAI